MLELKVSGQIRQRSKVAKLVRVQVAACMRGRLRSETVRCAQLLARPSRGSLRESMLPPLFFALLAQQGEVEDALLNE